MSEKFKDRMQRCADDIIETVTRDIRRAFSFDLGHLSEEDWDDIYAAMAERMRAYLCTKDGALAVEVQYGDNIGDHIFFPMSEAIDGLDGEPEQLEALAKKVDQLAAEIRAIHPTGQNEG